MLNSTVSSCREDVFQEKQKGDINFDDDDGRINRSREYGDSRGGIRVCNGRHGYSYAKTSHFFSQDMGETVGGDGRGGYRSHTSHYFSHNPGDHGRLFHIPGYFRHVDNSIH